MAVEESGVVEPMPRGRVSRVVVVCFCIAVVVWGSVTVFLTSAPKTTLAPVEARLRDNVVTQTLIPPMRNGRPAWTDLLEHFLVYAPFGFLAGIAGEIARRSRGRRVFWLVFFLFLAAAMGWAVVDEYRQIPLPDRSADWSDLFAGWAGILFGAVAYLAGRWLLVKFKRGKR